jgi:hypothetical protein
MRVDADEREVRQEDRMLVLVVLVGAIILLELLIRRGSSTAHRLPRPPPRCARYSDRGL